MQQYKKILGKVMMTAEDAWNIDKTYEPISLVTDEETNKSYISRKDVPAGIQINNREYWQPVASSGIIDNGVIILNRKNKDGQVPIYDLKSAAESVAIGDRRAGVILGFLGFNAETDTAPSWKLYQYNDVSPSNWTNIQYWLPMDYTNKYAGWYDDAQSLYASYPFPKVGMYAYVGNSASSAIVYRCYEDRVWTPTEDKAFTGVVNLADEEDITSKQNKLKFKDKEYNPAQFSGLGKLYLRKNIVDGKNVLTQNMMQATNTIYIIQYDYDLQGQTITIPESCILDFQGGSFSNGTIVGNKTNINWDKRTAIFGKGLHISINGSWAVSYISTYMFADLNYDNCLRDVFNLNSPNIQTTIYVEEGVYNFNLESPGSTGVHIVSNTEIVLNGTITLSFNWFYTYNIFYILNAVNVHIHGSGHIQGDRWKHNNQGGEMGTCIKIYRSDNILIEGITISEAWGDCIFAAAESKDTDYTSNEFLTIRNCRILNARRCGVAITSGENVIISNCNISGTTGYTREENGPLLGGNAIDIEPNDNDKPIKNVLLENIIATDNANDTFRICGITGNIDSINILNCRSEGGNMGFATYSMNRIEISNCEVINALTDSYYFNNVDNAVIFRSKVVANNKSSVRIRCIDCNDVQVVEGSYSQEQIFDEDLSVCHRSFIFNNNTKRITVKKNKIVTPKILYWQSNVSSDEFKKYDFIENEILLQGFTLYGKDNGLPNPAKVNIENNILIFDFTQRSTTSSIGFGSDSKLHKNIVRIYNQPAERIRFMTLDGCNNVDITANDFGNNSAKSLDPCLYLINALYCRVTDNIISSGIYNNFIKEYSDGERIFVVRNNINRGGTFNDQMYDVNVRTFAINKDDFVRDYGGSELRPINIQKGFSYLDTTLNKAIWWTGTKWVDATGAEV